MIFAAVLALAVATLVHHVHNAEFLGEYPNMPAWLSPLAVYVAWSAATVSGVAGYLLLRHGYPRSGIALLALYACYGLDGLVHYALAPISAHTAATNVTILLEAVTAIFLLSVLATRK